MTLEDLEKLVVPLREHVAPIIEFPEPAARLDMSAREGSAERQFKHLHQMCLMHAENFVHANQIKLVSLLDGYLTVARGQNVLGPYLFARSIFELSAFIYDVSGRLREIAQKPDSAWRAKGEEFFAMIVRARYGTTDPKKRQHLEAGGFPAKLLKPLNVMNSIGVLMSDAKVAETLSGQYDKLCDFVHHNLSSQVTSSPGFRVGGMAYSAGSGGIMMTKQAPITRYEYPAPNKAKLAIDETLQTVMTCAKVSIEYLNALPRTAFSDAQILAKTGTALGLIKLMPGFALPPRV